jgi:exocyst complex component 4
VGAKPKPEGSPGDPWAAERAQRSEARKFSKDTADAAAASQRSAGAGADKLRNAVGAFMSASKQKGEPARRPPRRKMTVTQHKDTWDDLMGGPTGGKFAEIDGRSLTLHAR